MPQVEGFGPDTPTVTNAAGASQSASPYRCDLLDGRAILSLSKVLAEGAAKYGDNNWRQIPTKDHINHALAHILAFQEGDNQEDRLEHAFCRLMMAVSAERKAKVAARKISDALTVHLQARASND